MTSPETESAPTPSPEPAMTVAQCAALLREHFPALFAGPARPLKLRIQADINERQPGVFPKHALSAFLRRHTMSDAYLKAMGKSEHRFDLDGQPAGEVSEEHRKIAQATLDERRSRQQAARAAEREQQGAEAPQASPGMPAQPDRPARPARQAQPDPQRQAQREAERAARREAERAERRAAAVAERNYRAGLLRDFETTTLTRENFCALKGVDPARLDEMLAVAQQERDQRRAFVNQLAAEFRASGKNVADFAATKNLHPAQVDRFLREAGAIGGGAGGGRRPERSERRSDERRGDNRRSDSRRGEGPRAEGQRHERPRPEGRSPEARSAEARSGERRGAEDQAGPAGPKEPTEGA